MLKISKITTENMTEGCVTDNPAPVFSFAIESDRKNVMLAKAVLSVNGWEIKTRKQTGIVYNGRKLKPFTKYRVTVTAEDNTGECASADMEFETGRMGVPWDGVWITDPEYSFTEKYSSPKPMIFLKKITVSRKIKSAKVYVTAMGIYELNLNGNKIGEDYFAPGYTSYKNQLQYQTYDVTHQLKESNILTIVAAGGWAAGAYTYKRMNRIYADRQAVLCELRITYEDGTTEVIGTDESWRVSEEGNYKEAEFYNGEVYDATVQLENIQWSRAGLENLRYKPKLLAQYGVPVRAHEIMDPVSCQRAEDGSLIYDFGQNFAGVISAKIKGSKGQKIVFSHAEILMDGELYTRPLRSAKQQAVYICKEGEQEYQPRLTYMGFRYVGVTGIEAENLELKAVALYSDIGENGSFTCSDERLNRLQRCIRWGAKSNFVDIPTDCPQRDERLGWTGDIALFASTAAYNFDMSRFFEKWLLDVRTEQGKGGGIPMTVPQVKIPMQFEMMFPLAVDHWGDACIWVPWAEYLARGNTEILKEMYPTMVRYLKACKFWAELGSVGKKRRIWKLLFHYGDWCAPDTDFSGWMKRGKWTATACLAYSSGLTARIAEILGKEEDARKYRELKKETAEAYRKILMEEDCTIRNEFQTGYVLPLYYGLLTGEDKKKAARSLAEMVRKGSYRIQTGFPGTPYILFALADNGYVDDAYKMLLSEECPSWLYEIKAGGTTFWERWDALREDGTCNLGDENGSGGMVSFNHYASGAVGDFLYRRVAGIESIEGGYKTFRIAPVTGGAITYARGQVETPYGTIISEWKTEKNIFTLKVTIPACTKCFVVLPGGNSVECQSGVWDFQEAIDGEK